MDQRTTPGGCDHCDAYRKVRPDTAATPYTVFHEPGCLAHRVRPKGSGRMMQANRDGECPTCRLPVAMGDWIVLDNRVWVHEGCA